MFLVDTNVLLDIFTDDANWRSWSEQAIRKVMEPLDIGKCFGQPQDVRQSPAFPATAFANAFSRMVASS